MYISTYKCLHVHCAVVLACPCELLRVVCTKKHGAVCMLNNGETTPNFMIRAKNWCSQQERVSFWRTEVRMVNANVPYF